MCAGGLHGACANCGAQTEVARYAHALAGARLAADASPWNVRPSVRPTVDANLPQTRGGREHRAMSSGL